MFRKSILFCCFVLVTHLMQAQISGYVTDSLNNPLHGASVLIDNTNTGVITNKNGYFLINTTPASFTLTVSFVGYITQHLKAVRNATLRIQLADEIIEFEEVVIKVGENPAYPIIRKAIDRRQQLEDKKDHYEATVYTKGAILADKMYDKLLSKGWVDSTEVRDSAGNIVFYLAESNNLITKIGDQIHEYIISSRRSGDSKGISMNFVQFTRMDFYKSLIPFNKSLVNPIGDQAFMYYDYELSGSYYEGNQKFYKIKLIPRRTAEPVFFGNIYIADETFDLKQVDLFTLGKNAAAEFIDTIHIKQATRWISGYEKQVPLNQTVSFTGGLLGIKVFGYFIGFYNNVNVLAKNAKLPDDRTLIEFAPGSTKKSESYWDTLRPISLTVAEKNDYQQRDSIAILMETKSYLDSIDCKHNKFKLKNVINSYRFSNSYLGISLSKGSFLQGIRFDPVQGFSLRLPLTFIKNNKVKNDSWRLQLVPIYAFSENKFRYQGSLSYHKSGEKSLYAGILTGHEIIDYNNMQPLPPLFNSIICLAGKVNYTRYYDKNYLSAFVRYQIHPDIRINVDASLQKTGGLNNNTNFSFFNKDTKYSPNYPNTWSDAALNYIQRKSINTHISFLIQPGTKLIKMPDNTYPVRNSSWPQFEITYGHGWGLQNAAELPASDFNKLELNIQNMNIPLRLLGNIKLNWYNGIFFGRRPTYRVDYHHFSGHKLYVKNLDDYTSSFKDLSYYRYSTNDRYTNWFVEWNMSGFLLKKIPLLNKTGFEEVLSCNGLWTPESGNILELGAGLTRIGIKSFRFLRFDYFWQFHHGKFDQSSFVIGVNFSFLNGAISLIN